MKFKSIFLLLITWVSLVACSPQNVTVEEINSLKINNLDLKSMDLDLEMRINNPNGYAIKVLSGELDIKINKIELGTVTSIQAFEVPRKSNQLQHLNVKIEMNGLASSAIAVLTTLVKKEVTVVMKGEILAKAGMFKKKIQVDQQDVVSLKK